MITIKMDQKDVSVRTMTAVVAHFLHEDLDCQPIVTTASGERLEIVMIDSTSFDCKKFNDRPMIDPLSIVSFKLVSSVEVTVPTDFATTVTDIINAEEQQIAYEQRTEKKMEFVDGMLKDLRRVCEDLIMDELDEGKTPEQLLLDAVRYYVEHECGGEVA